MQKRKITKLKQPEPIEMMEDIFMNQFAPTEESVLDMLSSLSQNSLELSKLVIDNKLRNSEKLKDEDIYDIYKKSVKTAMEAMESHAISSQENSNTNQTD
jgi:hypothetical protein